MADGDIAKLPFEQALAELEEIVKALEAGNVPLEKSISLYERGDTLKKHCDQLLKAAEARVEKITTDASGKASGTAPLDPDLADRLQAPVFVLTDLDIGMNQRLCAPFEWDDARVYDRGKVLTAEMLDSGCEFARYKDVDGDGIPWRTWPGTHPDKGAYFTRGTSRNPQAQYSERGPDYVYNMQRLLQKFDTARSLVPQPVITQAPVPACHGVIFYGSTSPAMAEAIELLRGDGIGLDTLRVRAYPFPGSVRDFILGHESVFVVEQNRDGQLRSLLVNEFDLDPARLVAVLHYDGTPITARFIAGAIVERVRPGAERPRAKQEVTA